MTNTMINNRNFGLQARILESSLGKIMERCYTSHELIGKYLQIAADFLSVAIVEDKHLFSSYHSSHTEFSACVRTLLSNKILDDPSSISEDDLKKIRSIVQGYLTDLNQLRLVALHGKLNESNCEKLKELQKFFHWLRVDETKRELDFIKTQRRNRYAKYIHF